MTTDPRDEQAEVEMGTGNEIRRLQNDNAQLRAAVAALTRALDLTAGELSRHYSSDDADEDRRLCALAAAKDALAQAVAKQSERL